MVNVVYIFFVFNTYCAEDTIVTIKPTEKTALLEKYDDHDMYKLNCVQKAGTSCLLFMLGASSVTCWAAIPFIDKLKYKIALLNGGSFLAILTLVTIISIKKMCYRSFYFNT